MSEIYYIFENIYFLVSKKERNKQGVCTFSQQFTSSKTVPLFTHINYFFLLNHHRAIKQKVVDFMASLTLHTHAHTHIRLSNNNNNDNIIVKIYGERAFYESRVKICM